MFEIVNDAIRVKRFWSTAVAKAVDWLILLSATGQLFCKRHFDKPAEFEAGHGTQLSAYNIVSFSITSIETLGGLEKR